MTAQADMSAIVARPDGRPDIRYCTSQTVTTDTHTQTVWETDLCAIGGTATVHKHKARRQCDRACRQAGDSSDKFRPFTKTPSEGCARLKLCVHE